MILDNVKLRLAEMGEEISFIKECLWQDQSFRPTESPSRWAGARRILFKSRQGAWSWQKCQKNWGETECH